MEPLGVFQTIVAWIARTKIKPATVRGIMAPVVLVAPLRFGMRESAHTVTRHCAVQYSRHSATLQSSGVIIFASGLCTRLTCGLCRHVL